MKLAVDTSVLYAILKREPGARGWADLLALRPLYSKAVVCEVVVAELVPFFDSREAVRNTMRQLTLEFDAISLHGAILAGEIHRRYREEGGSRERMVPDFLVAAHASTQADALATLDRGFYRRYFPDLRLLGPGDSVEG